MRLTRLYFGQPRISSVALVLMSIMSAPLAADSEVEAILECKSLQDDVARLACYDLLNSPPLRDAVVPAETTAPVVQDVPVEVEPAIPGPTAAAAQSDEGAAEMLSDKVGRETLGPAKGEEVFVRGHIVSCRKNLSGKYVFNFANGQVWRQKDNIRIRWKECDFEVTMSKDFFGYKMVRDGDKKKVRIAREK